MRIVGGELGGRTLKGPSNRAIRPTSDYLRESLFNIFEHHYGVLCGLRVIDLFAGTGALGIEALSRGADFALFVDESSEARALIRENVTTLGLGGISRIFRRDATRLGTAPAGEGFDLAFLDPPYGRDLVSSTLVSLSKGRWLKANAHVVVETGELEVFICPGCYIPLQIRPMGDSALHFFRYIRFS